MSSSNRRQHSNVGETNTLRRCGNCCLGWLPTESAHTFRPSRRGFITTLKWTPSPRMERPDRIDQVATPRYSGLSALLCCWAVSSRLQIPSVDSVALFFWKQFLTFDTIRHREELLVAAELCGDQCHPEDEEPIARDSRRERLLEQADRTSRTDSPAKHPDLP